MEVVREKPPYGDCTDTAPSHYAYNGTYTREVIIFSIYAEVIQVGHHHHPLLLLDIGRLQCFTAGPFKISMLISAISSASEMF